MLNFLFACVMFVVAYVIGWAFVFALCWLLFGADFFAGPEPKPAPPSKAKKEGYDDEL